MGHLRSSYYHLLSFLPIFTYLRTLSHTFMFENKQPLAVYPNNWPYREDKEEVQEVSPSIVNKKRKAHVVLDIPKKAKSCTVVIIQEQITKIVESASSFASKKKVELPSRKLCTMFWSVG
jgi:hypothetical protein